MAPPTIADSAFLFPLSNQTQRRVNASITIISPEDPTENTPLRTVLDRATLPSPLDFSQRYTVAYRLRPIPTELHTPSPLTEIEGNLVHIGMVLRHLFLLECPATALPEVTMRLFHALGDILQRGIEDEAAMIGMGTLVHHPGSTLQATTLARKDIATCMWQDVTPYQLSWILHLPSFLLERYPPKRGMNFAATRQLLTSFHTDRHYLPLAFLRHSRAIDDMEEVMPKSAIPLLQKLLVTYTQEFLQSRLLSQKLARAQ